MNDDNPDVVFRLVQAVGDREQVVEISDTLDNWLAILEQQRGHSFEFRPGQDQDKYDVIHKWYLDLVMELSANDGWITLPASTNIRLDGTRMVSIRCIRTSYAIRTRKVMGGSSAQR